MISFLIFIIKPFNRNLGETQCYFSTFPYVLASLNHYVYKYFFLCYPEVYAFSSEKIKLSSQLAHTTHHNVPRGASMSRWGAKLGIRAVHKSQAITDMSLLFTVISSISIWHVIYNPVHYPVSTYGEQGWWVHISKVPILN